MKELKKMIYIALKGIATFWITLGLFIVAIIAILIINLS